VRLRLFVSIATVGLLASLPGVVLAGASGSATPFAVTAAAPRAYAGLERVMGSDEIGFARPGGVAWSAREARLLVFDAARPGSGVAISTAGRINRAVAGDAAAGSLRGAAASRARASVGGVLRGLAVHPGTGHQFVYAPASRTLWELDTAGKPLTQRDLAGFGLDDVRAMAVAPSADSTDAANRMSVYLADAGRLQGGTAVGGGVYEVVLSAPQRASGIGILAVDAVALVNTINTGAGSGNWSPDSPDPSGLAYNSTLDRLVAVDGEVEETTGAGWNNANGWFATRSGSTTSTFNTTTLQPANKEPVGAAYDPARNELYVVKDGGSSAVWVYNASTMNVVRSFSVAAAPYNNADAEGVGFGNGVLYLVDAVDNDLVKVQPGANGIVGTGGDDVVNNYDLQQYGQDEPEGLDVHPTTGNIWVVSNKVSGGNPQPMLEVTPNGTLVSSVSIADANPDSPAGLAIAPPSGGGGGLNIYITDRGVDNASNPNENDGKIYEFEPGGEPPPPPPPGEKMTNRGFELDANGDNSPDNWTTNAAFTRSSAVVHSDSFSGRHSSTANAGYNVYQTATGITAGVNYAFSGWLNIPTTSDAFTFQIQLKWRGSGGAIQTDTIFTRTSSTSGWIQMNANATAPAGATSVRVTMKLKSLNATIYVDDFSLMG
jgi:hypothetical protein